MKTDKQELKVTFLAEADIFAPGGFELGPGYENHVGGDDIFIKLNDKNDIVGLARLVHKYGGRVITITPYSVEGGNEVAYHMDVGGMIITATTFTDDKAVPAITTILKSGDWSEREMKDIFGIVAVGHPCSDERLILDESMAENVFEEYTSLSDAMAGAATSTLWEHINEQKEEDNG